jgi:hypothetical protein
MKPSINGPATASLLNPTWLKITGRDRWLPTRAEIFSCDWTDLEDQTDSEVGYYHVVYSYVVAEERYLGKFADYGFQSESYFRRGDTFTVLYDPSRPSRSYYPELRTRYKFHLICFAIGAGLALLVGAAALCRAAIH